jgi:hypothetical protein
METSAVLAFGRLSSPLDGALRANFCAPTIAGAVA